MKKIIFKNNEGLVLVLSLVATTLMTGFVLSSITVSAINTSNSTSDDDTAVDNSNSTSDDDTAVDNVSVTVPVACTMSGTVDTAHTAEIANGIYTSNIGSTTLHAFCNDTEGFAIYASGYTGEEIGAEDSNKLVGTTSDIETGISTSGDTSQWAMKLTVSSDSGDTTTNPITIDSAPNVTGGSDASFSDYHAVPSEYVKVAHKNSSTDMTASTGGAKLTTTYAVYISGTQVADTYEGKVIYTLVHPSSANAPVICNEDATTISEVKCLQDFGNVSSTNRASIIDSMVAEQQYTLKDSRDGKTYTIAKYQTKYTDSSTGNETTAYDVWMTQNLDLDLNSGVTLTNEDTDLGYNTSTGEYETATWKPSVSTYTTDGVWNWSYTTPESYDAGNLYWNGTTWAWNQAGCESIGGTWDSSNYNCTDYISGVTASTGTAQYHLGNYYNWTAAVAMNDSSSYTTYDEIVEQSICPVGWTLPRIGTGEDTFYALWNQYDFSSSSTDGTDSLWTSPLYFAASGYFNGALDYVGYDGVFWSPVVRSVTDARLAYFDVVGVSGTSFSDCRAYGVSVRCVARPVVGSESGSSSGGGEDAY